MKMNNVPIGAIVLNSQSYLDFDDIEAHEFDIKDIARGLANTCRFGGQSTRFYSVAEHCVHASHIVPPELAFEALMHDAAEAYIGDIPRPLKIRLPDYEAIETRLEISICKQFKIDYPFSIETKSVDMCMLAAEQTQVMNNQDNWGSVQGFEPANVDIMFLEPEYAYATFIARFNQLYEASK